MDKDIEWKEVARFYLGLGKDQITFMCEHCKESSGSTKYLLRSHQVLKR